MQTTRCVIGLLCLCLTACATTSAPETVVRVVVEKQFPPETLVIETVEPIRELKINDDLVKSIMDYRAALQSCNDDKASLRKWMEAK